MVDNHFVYFHILNMESNTYVWRFFPDERQRQRWLGLARILWILARSFQINPRPHGKRNQPNLHIDIAYLEYNIMVCHPLKNGPLMT